MTAGIKVIGSGPTDRTIAGFKITGPDSVSRTIVSGRIIGTDSVDRVFWQPSSGLSVGITPDPVSGTTLGTGTAVTGSATAAPSGGTAPYTYAWSRTSYNHPTTPPTITAPTSASTAFTQTNIGTGEDYGATFRCTVTDSLGATANNSVSAIWSDLA